MVPQVNHCSEFRMPEWSILNCLWPIAKAIFVNKVQMFNITQSLAIYPWNPKKFKMKTYLMSKHKIGNNISRTNLKASRNKAVLVLQRDCNRNKPRYAKEVWTGLISTCLSGNVSVVWIETGWRAPYLFWRLFTDCSLPKTFSTYDARASPRAFGNHEVDLFLNLRCSSRDFAALVRLLRSRLRHSRSRLAAITIASTPTGMSLRF